MSDVPNRFHKMGYEKGFKEGRVAGQREELEKLLPELNKNYLIALKMARSCHLIKDAQRYYGRADILKEQKTIIEKRLSELGDKQ